MSERLQFHTFKRSSEKSNHLPLKKRPSQFDELLTLAEAEKQFILKTYE
jgi:hypothetical protein